MSHIATIEIEIKDVPVLKQACKRLGTVELRQDQRTFRTFGGQQNPCDMAIVIKDSKRAYEIGLCKRADGRGYEIKTDFWGQSVSKAIGQDGCQLKQLYAVEAAKNAGRKQGLRFTEHVLANGSIQLKLKAGAY